LAAYQHLPYQPANNYHHDIYYIATIVICQLVTNCVPVLTCLSGEFCDAKGLHLLGETWIESAQGLFQCKVTRLTNSLAGKRVVVTRAEGQSVQLVAMLREAGAVPIVFPTISIAPLDDTSELDTALRNLNRYDWAIFTSINGVTNVLARMQALGIPPSAFETCKVAAVGPATEALLRQQGINVALRPDEYVAEDILAGLLKHRPITGQRFLLLRVDVARAVLRDQLMTAGAIVDEIHVYRTTLGEPDENAYAELRAGVDIITFTSSSTIHNFFTLLGDEALSIMNNTVIACIGPITAETAREMGLHVDVAATEYTVSGLMSSLEKYLASTNP
jgi:uroporphyrinogen-III synthase